MYVCNLTFECYFDFFYIINKNVFFLYKEFVDIIKKEKKNNMSHNRQ